MAEAKLFIEMKKEAMARSAPDPGKIRSGRADRWGAKDAAMTEARVRRLPVGVGSPAIGSSRSPRSWRPHQWLKNLLLCTPALAAHRFDWSTGRSLLVAFVSLSLVASGSYVLNDLLDLDADGEAPARETARVSPLDEYRRAVVPHSSSRPGWPASESLHWALPGPFLAALGIYLLGDVVCIRFAPNASRSWTSWFSPGLYVIRVVAGGFGDCDSRLDMAVDVCAVYLFEPCGC